MRGKKHGNSKINIIQLFEVNKSIKEQCSNLNLLFINACENLRKKEKEVQNKEIYILKLRQSLKEKDTLLLRPIKVCGNNF